MSPFLIGDLLDVPHTRMYQFIKSTKGTKGKRHSDKINKYTIIIMKRKINNNRTIA